MTYTEQASEVEHIYPAPVVSYATPAPVAEDIALTPAVTYAAEHAPLVDYIVPAPVVSNAALTPVLEHSTPMVKHFSPVVEHTAFVLSVCAEHAHVDMCIAPAPAVACTVLEMIAYFTPGPAVTYTAQSPEETNAAPSPADDFRHTVERIIGAPVPQGKHKR